MEGTKNRSQFYVIAWEKESRKRFERSSDAADNALDRYLWKKGKEAGAHESAEETAELRKEFHNRSMEYVMELNRFGYMKKYEVLEHVRMMECEWRLSLISDTSWWSICTYLHSYPSDRIVPVNSYSQSLFFRQGFELFKDLEPTLRDVTGTYLLHWSMLPLVGALSEVV